MRISELKLTNFFGFSSFRLALRELNVLVGPNNGGKTTILRAIRLIFDAMEMTLDKYAEDALKWQRAGDAQTIRFEEQLSDPAMRAGIPADIPNREELHENRLAQLRAQHAAQREQHERAFPKWQCDVKKLIDCYPVNSLHQIHFQHREDQPAIVELFANTGVGLLRLTLEISDSPQAVISCHLSDTDLFSLDATHAERVFAELKQWKCLFLRPVTDLSAAENAMAWPQVQKLIAQGKDDEAWRNSLHWLCEGKPPETFHRIATKIQVAMPEIAVRPPARTRDANPRVMVTYNENDHEFDVSEAGAGLRTYLSVVASAEFSEQSLLLLDEPDSHLHSSVQRLLAKFLESHASDTCQIIIATHAPDMIDEFPLESLTWIDKSESEPRNCDDVAKTLAELGAVTHAQAIGLLKADALIYFEAKGDRKVFESFLITCGFREMVEDAQLEMLGGFGDIQHLPSFVQIASRHRRQLKVAVIRDGDYDPPRDEERGDNRVLVLRLPCKEIENLLLLQPEALARVANQEAQKRRTTTGEETAPLSSAEIEKHIDEVSASDVIRKKIENNWIATRLRPNTDGGELTKRQDEFARLWDDAMFRRRYGPGKDILACLRRWLQQERKVSFSFRAAFDFYEPTNDVRQLFEQIHKHFHPQPQETTED